MLSLKMEHNDVEAPVAPQGEGYSVLSLEMDHQDAEAAAARVPSTCNVYQIIKSEILPALICTLVRGEQPHCTQR